MKSLIHRLASVWALVLVSGALTQACRSPEITEVEVEIRSVGLDQSSRSPVVVLQDKEKKIALPIWIGPAEAQAIVTEMQGVNPPRPMTHDLMKMVLEESGIEFLKVVIEDLKDSTYYARIFLRNGSKDLELDSRPSDAIALAVRFQRPIFVATSLLQRDVIVSLEREVRRRGALTYGGITMQDLTEDLAAHFNLPVGHGVLVSDVSRDAVTPLRRGDVIVEVDGERVADLSALLAKLGAQPPGSQVDLSVRRGSRNVRVALSAVE